MSQKDYTQGHWLAPCLTVLSALSLQANQQNKPVAKIKIASEYAAALFDSGSNVSLISKRFFNKIKHAPNVKISPPNNLNLLSASGDPINIFAMIKTQVTIDNATRKALFYVTNNDCGFDVLIGTNFMERNDVTLSIGRKKITVGKERVDHGDYVASNYGMTLPGHHEAMLLLKMPPQSQCKEGDKIYVQPMTVRHDLQVEEALTTVTLHKASLVAPVLVRNLHTNNTHIDKGDVVCSVTTQKNFSTMSIRETTTKKQVQSPVAFVRENCDLTGIPENLRKYFFDTLVEFADTFSRDHLDVGKCDVVPHTIKLKPEAKGKIVNMPPIRQPFHLREVTNEYVTKMLDAGIIQRSDSPFSSPLFLVRKHNADLSKPPATWYRQVHNYKRINELIQAPAYPMRHMQDMIDEVSQKSIFSVLDLSQGFFNQVLHDPEGVTAFSVPGMGHFKYVRSAMGVVSSPAMFQKMMEKVLETVKAAFPYLDDIIIASDSYKDHLLHLRQTLMALRKHNVKLNLRKAQFGKKEVTYLGYELSNKTLKPGVRNVKEILKCSPPVTTAEIKSFLGMASFFRKCIPRFAEYSTHLSKLTRKDNPYTKGPLPEKALHAFRHLQKALGSRPCLKPVDYSKSFILTVDTSGTAHGAVLSQDHDGTEFPNSYASIMLSDADRKKSAFHRERLGIRWALKHFKPYLIGKSFLIRTDHKPLVSFQAGKVDVLDPVAADILQFAPFSVQYLPGPKMPADYLSRINATRVSKMAGDGPPSG